MEQSKIEDDTAKKISNQYVFHETGSDSRAWYNPTESRLPLITEIDVKNIDEISHSFVSGGYPFHSMFLL